MTLKAALALARDALKNIEDAPLEAELLLRHVLGIDRARLYLDLDKELSQRDAKAFQALIERRLKGEPSAYIIGRREFYGRDFSVNRHTLIPRPESELLVETALKIASERQLRAIADIGTGCGAIAITIALELPRAKVYATDISHQALEVAQVNCKKHAVENVRLLEGDTLEPLPEAVDLIIANLPYVRRAEIAPDNFEPKTALDGGDDGTEIIAELCRQAKDRLKEDGSMLLEIGLGQSDKVRSLLKSLFPGGIIEVFPDLAGIERVVALNLSRARVAG